jgi:septin family protein
VLPVIARADTLTNDRLGAVKIAVRRDLAEAGIGFGIFDVDHMPDIPEHNPINGDINGYAHKNGSTSSSSPTTSPSTPSFLRLPYALISPDMYSHSDGVTRIPISRHELVRQYTPSPNTNVSKLSRGRFVRSYRWGSMDVLDPNHSDFMPLRNAVFHHMKVRIGDPESSLPDCLHRSQTLQKYTKEYLFDKFRTDYLVQHQPPAHQTHSRHVGASMSGRPHMHTLSQASRPILAIETAPSHAAINRHPSLSMAHDVPMAGDLRSASMGRGRADSVSGASIKASSSSAASQLSC